MIVFAHTKFGLVQKQGNEVKSGAESPQSERVFEIPVRAGLNNIFIVYDTIAHLLSI